MTTAPTAPPTPAIAATAGQQTITPERQVAASQIGAVFNSLHEYVRTLEHKDLEGRALLTKHLEFAHQRIDEAAMWVIKHVLTYGTPPLPAPPQKEPPAPSANDETAKDATPAPIGVVDPAQELVMPPAEAIEVTAAALAPDATAETLPTNVPATPTESM
jgi:hypothetical protein